MNLPKVFASICHRWDGWEHPPTHKTVAVEVLSVHFQTRNMRVRVPGAGTMDIDATPFFETYKEIGR